VRFTRVPLQDVDWSELDAFEDRTFCQRHPWLDFLRESQRGEPVVARLDEAGQTLGYFTGVIVRKFGVPILGSPFPGWTTPFMGFNLRPNIARADAVRALTPFAFRELRVLHIELADPELRREDVEGLAFAIETGTTFVSDLTRTEDELLAGMTSACRRAIRKAEKSGVVVEEAEPQGFAEEFHAQLTGVFARQGLRPTYGRERVASLIRNLYSSGDLLLLRARDADGQGIATAIFVGHGNTSYFWGNASLREHQILRPNEPLHWYALRAWKQRGARVHLWGGGGEYKRKYGARQIETLHLRMSKYPVLGQARGLARTVYQLPRTTKRRLRASRSQAHD
jgi:hypothetical protein